MCSALLTSRARSVADREHLVTASRPNLSAEQVAVLSCHGLLVRASRFGEFSRETGEGDLWSDVAATGCFAEMLCHLADPRRGQREARERRGSVVTIALCVNFLHLGKCRELSR